jgi:1-acyl-sn-glycerol-3-phosphate acyltransferase
MLRTLIVVILFGLCILFVLPWLILWSLLTGTQDLMYFSSMKAVDVVLRIVGVRVRVEGLENIPAGTCIFAANHVSNIDPLAFAPHIPRRVAIPLKKELFRIPILSYGMRLAKFIVVDRESRKAAADSLRLSLLYLQQGFSFAVYPEGTRSPDGRLGAFKRGAFLMAVEARVPVVPVSIAGARKLMPKGEWAIHPGEVLIRFGPPVETSDYTIATLRDLVSRVHASVAAGLPPDQQPLPQASETAASAPI